MMEFVYCIVRNKKGVTPPTKSFSNIHDILLNTVQELFLELIAAKFPFLRWSYNNISRLYVSNYSFTVQSFHDNFNLYAAKSHCKYWSVV